MTNNPPARAKPLYRTACQGVKNVSMAFRRVLCAHPSRKRPATIQAENRTTNHSNRLVFTGYAMLHCRALSSVGTDAEPLNTVIVGSLLVVIQSIGVAI